MIDPVLESAIWMIHNSGPATSLTDMKVWEAREKLTKCGFRKPATTGDDFIKQLIQISSEHHDDKILRNATTKAMLLIARWQEYRWANNHIISRLLDTLGANFHVSIDIY
jgi:hypothetical protein